MSEPFRISVLISGGGTTLKNLLEKHASGGLNVEIADVISSNPNARGLEFADQANVANTIIDHREFVGTQEFSHRIFERCRTTRTDLVVMGGFLRRVTMPPDFENRVINIHPSLIPAFCGRGQYGSRVHQSVIEFGCKISGCTVHFVDDQYDHGPIIAQSAVPVLSSDTPESLAARIFEQECQIYPEVINWIAARRVRVDGRVVTIDSQPATI